MTTRTLKLLTASTAFVAAASAANAVETIATNIAGTAPIVYTSATDIIVNVSGSSVVSMTGGKVINFDNTGVGSLSISSSAVVRGDTDALIETGTDDDLTGMTINVSGSLISTKTNGKAYNDTDTAGVTLTLRNTGLVSGSVTTKGNGGTLTYVGSGTGLLRGNLTSAATGADTVDVLDSSRIDGDVSLGAGNNVVTVSGTGAIISSTGGTAITTLGGDDTVTVNNGGKVFGGIDVGTTTGAGNANTINVLNGSLVSGTITGGALMDNVTISGSTVRGLITLGNGSNAVTLKNATLTLPGSQAVYTGGSGKDVVTVSGSSVISGTMDFGTAGGDADALNVFDSTFTTKGDIANLENFTVSQSTVNLNNKFSGQAPVTNIVNGSVLNINHEGNTVGNITLDGTSQLNVTSGSLAMGTMTATAGAKVGLTLTNSTTMAALTSAGAIDMANVSVSIVVGSNAGYITSGTTFKIVDAGAGSTDIGTLLTTQSGVLRFSLDNSDANDTTLRIGRVSTSSVVTGAANQALANSLEVLGNNASGSLFTAQGLISAQTSAAGVQNVVESLNANIDGVGAASAGVTAATGQQVSNRLASLRSGSALSGVATGDKSAGRTMWVEGFGNTTEQDNKDGQKGYDADATGATFGFDTDTLAEGYTTGAAFSYAKGNVESKAAGGASTDIDSYIATLYGSRVLDNGVFVNAQAGLGLNNYDSTRTVSGIGTGKGDWDGWQGTLKGEVGKDYAKGDWTLTPMASMQYTYLDMDSYTETGLGGANLTVNPESLSSLDLGLGGQAAYTVALDNGGTLKPDVHARYIYRAGDDQLESTSQFTGGGAAFKTAGVKSDRSSVNLGAGLLLTTAQGVDFSVKYDADIRDSLTGHTGQLKARWAF